MKITLIGAVFLLFLALKLIGIIAWSWWWITAPIWIPAIWWIGLIAWIVISITYKKKRKMK